MVELFLCLLHDIEFDLKKAFCDAFIRVLQTLLKPTYIDSWLVVNFSARCDLSYISRELISCGRKKGIVSYIICCSIILHGNL